MDHLQNKKYWASMRDDNRRGTREGIVDPENKDGEEIYYDGCADR